MKKQYFVLAAFAISMLFFACKKDSETSTPTDNSTLITSGAWKISAYSSTSSNSDVQTMIEEWNADIKATPLFVTYTKSGTYAYSDSLDTGTWELSNSKTILYNKGTADALSANIDELTSNKFTITYEFAFDDSTTVKVTESATR